MPKKNKRYLVAVCIDLSLAAQAESPNEAIEKLEAMIDSYIKEALGIHKDYAKQLLSRKAPLSQMLSYYQVGCFSQLNKIFYGGMVAVY